MRTMILPGYSVKNKDWAEEIESNLNLGHDVLAHEWKHWVRGSFSVDYELTKVMQEIGDEETNIIAKSVGTSVAMHIIGKASDQITKLILCGIPIKNFGNERRDLFIKNLSHFPAKKLTVIQNSKDYFGSFGEVKKFIVGINSKFKVIEKERSDHHYPYPALFQKILSK